MIRYEFQKIFGSAGGRIALFLYMAVVILACFLAANGFMNVDVKWINEQGESERGFHAVQKLKAARNEWEGWLDEEMLNNVIQENQRINSTPEGQSDNVQQSNIAYGWKQGFHPIRNLINRSFSDGFRSYDYYTADKLSAITEETFYANRIRQLKDWLYDERLLLFNLTVFSQNTQTHILCSILQLHILCIAKTDTFTIFTFQLFLKNTFKISISSICTCTAEPASQRNRTRNSKHAVGSCNLGLSIRSNDRSIKCLCDQHFLAHKKILP